MTDLTRGERLQIMLTPEELKALDDWRFSRRMPSRAAAVRELLRRGLEVDGLIDFNGAQKSEDYGVTHGDATSRRPAKEDEPTGTLALIAWARACSAASVRSFKMKPWTR